MVDKFYKSIELVCAFGLSCASFFIIWEVVEHYTSGISSFAISEKPVTELPTIILCLFERGIKPESEFSKGRKFSSGFAAGATTLNLNYETDFMIEYHVSDYHGSESIFLKEGKNSTIMQEMVSLEILTTLNQGTCYKVRSISNFIRKGSVRRMTFNFNESTPFVLKSFITSEDNAYGIVQNVWMDGKVSRVDVKKSFYVETSLKPLQRKYLKSKSDCNEKSFYECYGNFLATILEGCPNKCHIFSLRYLSICNTAEERKCVENKILNQWRYIIESGICKKQCTSMEYLSDIIYEGRINNYFENGQLGFGYRFSTPETVTFYEEYLIYDVEKIIGEIGGTLGILMGLSFMKILSYFINIVKRWIMFKKSKFTAKHKQTNVAPISLKM